jgi:hypothetical protein
MPLNRKNHTPQPVREAHNAITELTTGHLFTPATPAETAANLAAHAGHSIHPHHHEHTPDAYRFPQRCSSRWHCTTCHTWFTATNCYTNNK